MSSPRSLTAASAGDRHRTLGSDRGGWEQEEEEGHGAQDRRGIRGVHQVPEPGGTGDGAKTGDLTEHPLVEPSLRAVALVDDPLVAPSLRAVAATYDAAHSTAGRDLACAESSLTGEPINRFTHLHQSPADLVAKVRLLRHLGNVTACCFQRCVGLDAANAVFSVTFECDRQQGTHYHDRFREFWREVQRRDLTVDGAMTDPKGDRGKRPAQQGDPDLYLRVVDRHPDGVVIRGAKLHQTGMLNSHEILVMPTMAMRPGEEQYAVCCAVPTGAPRRPPPLRPAGERHAQARAGRARRRQRGLRRAGGDDGLRGRLRPRRARLPVRRGRLVGPAGRALRRLPPPELRRLQGRRRRRADRRGGAARAPERRGRAPATSATSWSRWST